jgi:hypothetical protein
MWFVLLKPTQGGPMSEESELEAQRAAAIFERVEGERWALQNSFFFRHQTYFGMMGVAAIVVSLALVFFSAFSGRPDSPMFALAVVSVIVGFICFGCMGFGSWRGRLTGSQSLVRVLWIFAVVIVMTPVVVIVMASVQRALL